MKLKNIASAFLACVLAAAPASAHVYAAEQTQDGVILNISSDKTAYEAQDQITVRVSLENSSNSDLTDVTLKAEIPAHYQLSDASKAVWRTTYIQAGSSVSSELVLIPDAPAAEPEKQATAVRSETEKTPETQLTENASAGTNTQTTESINPVVREKTGNGTKWIAAGIALLALCGIVTLIVKKGKGRAGGSLVLLCIAAGALYPGMDIAAVESDAQSFSVSETVTVGQQKLDLTVSATYSVSDGDMQAAVEEYYEDNSEKIVSVEEVREEAEVFTEKEAIQFMAERGFADYPLTYDYNMDGSYADEAEASAESDEKHPMYQTYFVSENGSVWTVFIVGKSIAANPASYNLESDLDAQVLVSETDTLTSYTEMGNRFYTTIPKESAVILKVVDQITSQKLNELTYEEVMHS